MGRPTRSTSRPTSSAESEHGPDSPVVLVVTSPPMGDAVQAEIERQVPTLSRQDEIRTALSRGTLVEAPTSTTRSGSRTSTPPSTSRSPRWTMRRPLPALRHAGCAVPGRLLARGRRRLRERLQPYAAHRAGSRVPTVRCRSRRSGAGCSSTDLTRDGLAPSATAWRSWPRPRVSPRTGAPWTSASNRRPPTPHHPEDRSLMASASPVAAARPQVYTWEPSNAAIAARTGSTPASVLRFDLNTSPFANPVVTEVLAGPFDPPAQRVSGQPVPRPRHRRGRIQRRRPVGDRGRGGRGRGPGHHREGVPAARRARHRAHPDLLHVRRADQPTGRDARRGTATPRRRGLRDRPRADHPAA